LAELTDLRFHFPCLFSLPLSPQEYFEGDNVDHSSEPPSAKGLAVFRDPLDEKRTATSINWHPDPAAPAKIAVSYSDLTFQNAKFATTRMPQQSFIWDILNPNTPDSELLPPSPLCCLRFNPKNTDSLVGTLLPGCSSMSCNVLQALSLLPVRARSLLTY
jgi:hypothetical protein